MRKIFKRAMTLVLAAVLLCSLCGCAALDALRESQVYYDEAGNILCNGVTYKLLPASDYLAPELDYDNQLFLTESDVPVLLSPFMATGYLMISTDGSIIFDGQSYYCTEEKYDQLSQRLQEGFEPEVVCYFYGVYNEDIWEYEEKTYQLTEEQIAAIELVVTTVEPVSYSQTGMYPDYDYTLDIYECSADMLLQACTTELIVYGQRYYLAVYTDADTLIFTVPEGCNEVFGQIVSTYENVYGSGGADMEFWFCVNSWGRAKIE